MLFVLATASGLKIRDTARRGKAATHIVLVLDFRGSDHEAEDDDEEEEIRAARDDFDRY